MKKLLFILLCLPILTLAQQTYVPDDNFEAYLEANGMGNGISNDDYVTTANINMIDSLFVDSLAIAYLTGIEDFTSLEYLICSHNQLTTLDVSQNTALTTLYCNNNLLTSLDVSGAIALTNLQCKHNQLTSLDASNNTALIILYCEVNQLISLDISNNTALIQLVCYNNLLTNLNVNGAIALAFLECTNNQLTSLNVTNNTFLGDFRCINNLLTNLNVSNNTFLSMFDCRSNQLTSLDVSNNTTLTNLYCGSNQLTSLDLSNNINLTLLYCPQNQLTILDVSNNANLISLACQNNLLSTLDLRNGNNQNMATNSNWGNHHVDLTNNPNLYCVDVDDASWADTNWTVTNGNIDSTMSFSANCATAFGCLDSLACNYNPLATIDDSSCGYNTSSYDTLSVTASIIWNGLPLSVSGDYSVILTNSVGCDSIVNLNLTITNPSGILNITNTEKTLLKITDMLGQETPYKRNTPLFYIYDDGTVEKRIVIK